MSDLILEIYSRENDDFTFDITYKVVPIHEISKSKSMDVSYDFVSYNNLVKTRDTMKALLANRKAIIAEAHRVSAIFKNHKGDPDELSGVRYFNIDVPGYEKPFRLWLQTGICNAVYTCVQVFPSVILDYNLSFSDYAQDHDEPAYPIGGYNEYSQEYKTATTWLNTKRWQMLERIVDHLNTLVDMVKREKL